MDLGVGQGVGHRAVRPLRLGHRAGQQDANIVTALFGHPVGEHHLVGEDIGLVAVEVVEPPQLLVEEARWSSHREDPVRLEVVDIAQGAIELTIPLLLAERLLGAFGQLIHHREPDGARELEHVDVDVTELGEGAKIRGPCVVLVEQGGGPVVDPQG
jgi:hypothetical protein